MSKAAITHFAIDLKSLPDGDLRILELVELDGGDRSLMAGLSGMQLDHAEAQAWVQDHVYGHAEQLGLPVYGLSGYGYPARNPTSAHLGMLQIDWNKPFDPEDLSTYACLLVHAYTLNSTQKKYLKNDLQERVLVTNQNILCQQAYTNKACFYALAQGAVPDLLPRQHIYAVRDGKVDAARILDDFAGHAHLVLKQPENFGGMGVDIRPASALRRGFLRAGAEGAQSLRLKFPLKAQNLLVVQEVVAGKPVAAKNQAGREGLYDPAIRVVASAWHSKGQTFVKCHGAYYKFPGKPLEESHSRRSLVSNVHGKGPRGGVVDDQEKSHIYAQIESRLPPLFDKLLCADPVQVARDIFENPDPAMRMVGAHLAGRIGPDAFQDRRRDDVAGAARADFSGLEDTPPIIRQSGYDGSDIVFSTLAAMMAYEDRERENPKGFWGRLGRRAYGAGESVVDIGRGGVDVVRMMFEKRPRYSAFMVGTFITASANLAFLFGEDAYSKWDYADKLRHAGEEMAAEAEEQAARYQNVTVMEGNFSRRSQQLRGAATREGLRLCTAAEPFSEAQSKVMLQDFMRAAPDTRFIGVRMNDAFHVFAQDCPEQIVATPY